MERKISHGPERQSHEADEEKDREAQDAVDHLFLGNQVHKKAGDEEGLATGNDQRDGDVDLTAGEMNVRSPDGQNCADDERDEYQDVPAHMRRNMVVMLRMGLIAHKSE